MFGIDGTMIIYTLVILIVSLVAGFGIGYYLKEISDREIIKTLQEEIFDNNDLEEKIKKVLDEIVKVLKERALEDAEFGLKVYNHIEKSESKIIPAIENKLDTKIAELIEESRHAEKNREKDVNHFYGQYILKILEE